MEKNLLLALLLSALVYVAWFGWLSRTPPQTSPVAQAPESVEGFAEPLLEEETGFFEEAPQIFEKEAYRAGFSVGKGALVRWDWLDEEGEPVALIPGEGAGFFRTEPEVRWRLLSRDGSRIQFAGNLPGQVVWTKEFSLGEKWVDLRLTLENPSRSRQGYPRWSLLLGPGPLSTPGQNDLGSQLRAIALFDAAGEGKFRKLDVGEAGRGVMRWVGLDNHYFLAALLPEPDDAPAALPERGFRIEKKDSFPEVHLLWEAGDLPPRARQEWKFRFYLGPKDYERLQSLGSGLKRSVDFGFFSFLGKIAFVSLLKLKQWTGNYGWAIVLLTMAIQVLMLPLSLKSTRAMAAMKKLQPQMKLLQEKFKNDPRRLNVEMMQLYKVHKANPLGGCLPMLAQLPVFWALFTTLRNAWELRGAPFVLWIRDLSIHDPYYVLPLLMGGTMVLQQRLNPASADPGQAKVMTWMPVLFTFMFLRFPSGLVLYWLTNNILNICQQGVLLKRYR
ncbi:MAG: membrane protein insertase YidC [Elusimicrobia bacterium]|nr:membrane protein insertase YidC [Elusimicrobiota bacterium]